MPYKLGFKPHKLANIFPPLDNAALAELAADIRANGLREPITLFEGKILDGRSRYLACKAARIEPRFETFQDDDALAYVISLNLKGRHLDESQRAIVAANIAKLPRGANQHAQICAPSQAQASDMLKVSRRSVQHAGKVLKHGVPELAEKVQRGEVKASRAAKLATMPKDKQRQVILGGPKAMEEAFVTLSPPNLGPVLRLCKLRQAARFLDQIQDIRSCRLSFSEEQLTAGISECQKILSLAAKIKDEWEAKLEELREWENHREGHYGPKIALQ